MMRPLQPQRGCNLQPRIAASATLGKETIDFSTATRLRWPYLSLMHRRNRVAVENYSLTLFWPGDDEGVSEARP